MDSYNINSAQSTANALTRSNQEWNETVRNARAQITTDYVNKLASDKSKKSLDQDLFAGQDILSAVGLGLKQPKLQEAGKQWEASTGVCDFLSKQYESARKGNAVLDDVHSAASSLGGSAVRFLTPDQSTNPYDLRGEQELQDASTFSSASREESDELGADPLYRNSRTAETSVETDATTPSAPAPNTESITSETAQIGETVESDAKSGLDRVGQMFDKASEMVGKAAPAIRIAGNVGGYIDDVDLIKNGFHANGDTLKQTSEWLGGAGALLDTIGVAIPVLEPVGALLNLGGAIADSVDAHEQDTKQVTQTDPNNYKSQLARQKYKNNTPLDNLGLVASQNNHVSNVAGGGVGAF